MRMFHSVLIREKPPSKRPRIRNSIILMVAKLIACKLWYLSRLVCVVTEDMFSNEVAQVLPGLCAQKMHA